MPRTFPDAAFTKDRGVPIKNPSAASPPGLGPKTIDAPRMRVYVATRPPAPPRQSHISEEIRGKLKDLDPTLAAGIRRVGGSK